MKELLFKITNGLSIFLACIALIAIVLGYIKFMKVWMPDQTVEYTEVEQRVLGQTPLDTDDFDEDLAVTQLIEEFDLGVQNKPNILNMVAMYDADQQEAFFTQVNVLLQKQSANLDANDAYEMDKFETLNTFSDLYSKKVKATGADQPMYDMKMYSMFLVQIMGVLLFIVFMSVPVLIQIERNTRTIPNV